MSKPPQKNKTSAAVNSTIGTQQIPQLPQIQVAQQVYQGPIPHPDILRGFDALVPGTAKRLIDMAEEESQHRRLLETKALEANATAQTRQLDIVERQTTIAYRSDTVGQIAGFLLSTMCVAGAVWLAMHDHEVTAAALAAIPTAAIIKAFFSHRKPVEKQ